MNSSQPGGGVEPSANLVFVSGATTPPEVPQPHRLVRVWDALGVAGAFGTEGDRLKWMQTVDYAEFAGGLALSQGILTTAPATERGFSPLNTAWHHHKTGAPITGDEAATYLAPDASLREPLLRRLHRVLGGMDDLQSMSKLSATVIAELQAYRDANKRMGRIAYRLGTHGYDGSLEAQASFTLSIANRDPESAVDFEKMHDILADYYAETVVQEMTPDNDPMIGSVEPVAADTVNPAFNEETNSVLKDFLNEPYFNRALLVAWSRRHGYDLSSFMDAEGNISADALFRTLPQKAALEIFGVDDNIKAGFINAIIRAYANGEESIFGNIHYLTEPYWPVN